MSSRTRLSWCPLLGVLLVVLGAFCGPAVAAESTPAKPKVSVQAEVPAEASAEVSAGVSAGVPGCGKGGQQDAGQAPAAPPRSSSAYELLPALHQAHAASGAWGFDQTVPSLTPERGPPPLAPPSPVDLSILRV
ncbi:hypothetical protein GCM10009837_31560 [Streptomyces durmitorensis]|uniref:Uncharacterized protein n=1 Tax=Streptomyces durmitorensis TaxID=319947 RepID=A0ABY4PV65_9ACTN|nr:hypothetical protein [Streptomyces durmitorensis]UQT57661.1 hypothetical protein M4V62_22585 [Streptomyces durmitorensis]